MQSVCIHNVVFLMTACCIAVQVHMPLPPARLEELCYSGLEASENERNVVVHSLLQALHQLEASVGIGSEVRGVIEGGSGDWMGQYMLKREFSEGSFHVFGIVVPDLRTTHASGHHQTARDCHGGVCQSNTTSASSDECDLGVSVVEGALLSALLELSNLRVAQMLRVVAASKLVMKLSVLTLMLSVLMLTWKLQALPKALVMGRNSLQAELVWLYTRLRL